MGLKYVIYFNIKKAVVCTQDMFIYFMWLTELSTADSLNIINWLISVIETRFLTLRQEINS
jgi:membrane protein insertase Oxa1/YidC/SpoIIIJ